MGFVRFLLAISVLFLHSSPIFGITTTMPGYLAVQLFYMISGYLMTLVFTEKYQFTDKPYYYYISNRFLRLFPMYWFVVFCTLVLSMLFGIFLGSYGKLHYYYSYYHEGKASLSALLLILLNNFTLIGQDILTFFNVNPIGGFSFLGLQTNIALQELLFIPIAWTVSLEFMFYLITPFIALKSISKVILMIAIVILVRFILYMIFNVDGGFTIYRFAPTELFWYLLGVLSYKLHKKGYLLKSNKAIYPLLLIIILTFIYKWINYSVFTDIFFYSIVFISSGSLIDYYAKNKFDKYLGDLCYPLYLSHALFLLIISANSFPKNFGIGLPLFILTFIFSVFSNKYIINPIEAFRKKRLAFNV